ncbi:MAG: T9SS type A sorting domain-containing protein [Ignavibacteria bacterium]|nr:T9SS type A sorting domain-containing protein [Ignavibacteria bacterium]
MDKFDTLAFQGNNVNSGFIYANFGSFLTGIFNSDRSGNYRVYATSVYSSGGANFQDRVITDEGSDNSNFHAVIFPIITENLPHNSSGINSINFQAAAHVKKSNDSVRVKFHTSNFSYPSDSTTAGNSTANVSIAMNRGIKFGNLDARVWVIYNKDSSSYSMLYGRYINIIISGIVKTELPVPQNFILHQNYPNPFNPVTKIRFGIPDNSFVKIAVYDALGKSIETLVNENLSAGSYEVQFDGSKFAAGVYYCRLTSEGFSDVKKLILLK